MTTRYGFEGDDPKTGTPPAAEKPNLAKTVFGHEVHLPSIPGRGQTSAAAEATKSTATDNEPRINQPTILAGSQQAVQAISPQLKAAKASKLSTQPASSAGDGARQGVARFLGRRNTAGNIVPLTQTEIELPRAPWIGPALTVGLAAVGSFLIVAVLLWLIGPNTTQPAISSPPEKTPIQTTKPIVAAPPRALPVAPVIESPPATPPVQRANVKPLRTKAGRVRHAKSADPDAPLPPTFF